MPTVIISLVVLLALALFFIQQYPKMRDNLLYPLRYRDEIVSASQAFDLDADLVAAIVMCESSFDPKAVSRVGAVGLMQVMPETGEWVAGKFGDAYYDEILEDPETNLKYGCWYMRYLWDRFDGDLTLVLAGYNAGGNNVAKWLKDPALSDDGATLHTIPNREPREYVVKVKKAYEAYRRIHHLQRDAQGQ